MVNTDTILRLIGYRTGVRDKGALSFYRFLRDTLKQDIADLVTPTRSVTKDDRLVDALEIMIKDHVNDLPVVDAEGRLIGELVSLELFLKGRELFNSEADKGGSPGSP
jgi:CBS domain-containing protein